MVQNLQTLQVVLYALPVLTLLVIGLVILLRPVAVISRRWLALAFLPLLLDNLLAIFGNETLTLRDIVQDGYFWLVLGTDLILGVGAVLALRGSAVYGLTEEQAIEALSQVATADGAVVNMSQGMWRSFPGRASEATVMTWTVNGESESVYLISRFGEVLLRGYKTHSMKRLKGYIKSIRRVDIVYNFRQHAVGVLYLVLAVVLAVFGWIYFFEPRLILVE